MSNLLKNYYKILKNYPVLTQCVQSGLLMGTGDAVSQTLIERKSLREVNFMRTVKFFGIGTLVVGPVLTTWYSFLAKQLGTSGKSVALKKVALDQGLMAPALLGTLLTVIGVVQKETFEGVVDAVKRDYKDVLINNYKLWPAVQLVNFYFIPLQYQVLTVQFVAVFWNSYLSWKTQAASK